MKRILVISLFIFTAQVFAQADQEKYILNDSENFTKREFGTNSPPIEEVLASNMKVEDWLSENNIRDDSLLIVYVAWHVIHATNNQGNLTNAQILSLIHI